MRKPPRTPMTGEIVETLTFTELCQSCNLEEEWVVSLVEQGILNPEGSRTAVWRFEGVSLTRATRAWRLQRDLGINLEGIALVLDLLEDRERLRRRLAHYERHDPYER